MWKRKKQYLRLDLAGRYLETEFSRSWAGGSKTSFRQLQETLSRAGQDRKISLILLCLQGQALGWNQIHELRGLITRIREQGKTCWAFLEEGQLSGYMLASSCDRILAPLAVALNLIGFGMEQIYLREFLDEWGLQPELQAKGKFKSAAEIFTNRGMSEPARQMMTGILEQLRDQFIAAVTQSRSLSRAQVLDLIDDAPYSAARALEAGLIDQIAYDDELEALVKKEFGSARKARVKKFQRAETGLQRLLHPRRPRIAYIVAEGMILGTTAPMRNRPTIDGKLLRQQFKRAREDKKIRAVVLRINSPGGDATISDLIWREIERTNQKKPVIASLGDMAASGGFYMAVAARRRLAMLGTLTGSIGVVGGKFNARGLFEKFKLHGEAIYLGERAGLFSSLREQTESEKQAMSRQLQETYDLFLERVSQGTGKSPEEVLELAGGRIWTGADAVRLGLADGVGGIPEAFAAAISEAGLPAGRSFRTVSFTRKRGIVAALLESR